jgi:hypothetical protein
VAGYYLGAYAAGERMRGKLVLGEGYVYEGE